MITPEELYRLGCSTLGLIHPADRDGYRDHLLHLGTFAILDSDTALDACVNKYLASLKRMAQSTTNDRADEQKQLSAAGWPEDAAREWREHYERQEEEIDDRGSFRLPGQAHHRLERGARRILTVDGPIE